MREFDVLEKNEHYYICSKGSGYCQIIIDENSRLLPLGKSMLHTEDISDRYIHQTKGSIFRLILPYEKQHDIQICTLATKRSNIFTYKRCLQLGGKWAPILGEWVFSAAIKNEVDKLGEILNSENVHIEATFEETITQINKPLTLFGFPLIKSSAPNGQVRLHNGVKLTKGELAQFQTSSGEKSIILAHSKIRLYIPSFMLNDPHFNEDYLCVVKIENKRKQKNKRARFAPSL